MAVGARSYGSAAGVAALAGVWTNAGVFDGTTRPTITQVESFIDNVSAIVNTLLAELGFTIPVTQDDAKLMLSQFTQEAAADLVAYSNGTGRFYADRIVDKGLSTTQILTKDFSSWLESHALGLENLGANRTTAKLGSIGYRDSDESGNEVEPIFTRTGFGGSNNSYGSGSD